MPVSCVALGVRLRVPVGLKRAGGDSSFCVFRFFILCFPLAFRSSALIVAVQFGFSWFSVAACGPCLCLEIQIGNTFLCPYVFEGTCLYVPLSLQKTCTYVLLSLKKTCLYVLMSLQKHVLMYLCLEEKHVVMSAKHVGCAANGLLSPFKSCPFVM